MQKHSKGGTIKATFTALIISATTITRNGTDCHRNKQVFFFEISFQCVILFTARRYIFIRSWPNKIKITSTLWILLFWCSTTRASVAIMLITHPCVCSCLLVNLLIGRPPEDWINSSKYSTKPHSFQMAWQGTAPSLDYLLSSLYFHWNICRIEISAVPIQSLKGFTYM